MAKTPSSRVSEQDREERHHSDRQSPAPDVSPVLSALSDTDLVPETHAWLIGKARSVEVLQRRVTALLPDSEIVVRTPTLAAWASRRHSLTIVYWLDERDIEITIEDDVDVAIQVIVDDIVDPVGGARERPVGEASGPAVTRQSDSRYVSPMSEPVVTRVVAVENLPLGSPASRRLVAAWSDGTESEALEWFSDDWLVSEGDIVGLTRDQIRSLAHRRDVQSLRDDAADAGSQFPFFES